MRQRDPEPQPHRADRCSVRHRRIQRGLQWDPTASPRLIATGVPGSAAGAGSGWYSATILAIAPDSTVLYATAIIEP